RWGTRLFELAHGVDDRTVQPSRPTLQVSSEDTFEHDLRLDEIAPHIERLAGKTWTAYRREIESGDARVARTVVLKLKTSDFRILTRSLTPPTRPTSLQQLVDIACDLRERVGLPARTRYRLVGVGLAGMVDRDSNAHADSDLFASAGTMRTL
ncbi:MAG: DNA polymerase IV, partial [Lysobacterales bacterium]